MRRILIRQSRRYQNQRSLLSYPLSGGARSSSACHPLTEPRRGIIHEFSLPQGQTGLFSTTVVEHYPDNFHERVELDSSLPLSTAVKRLLNIPLGQVHRLDFINKFPNMLRACCKAGKIHEAQLLFERMLQEKRESGRIVPAKVFETLIFGHAKIAKKEPKKAVQDMMDMVRLMEYEHEYDFQHALEDDEGKSCQPTTETYNTVLRGMAEAATYLPAAARDARSLLKTMETVHREKMWHTKPNNRSYTYVIAAYGNVRSKDSGDLAEAVLNRMKQIHKLEMNAYESVHGEAFDSINPENNKVQIVTPDTAAYTATIRAHANCGSKDAAKKAYAVLTEMHEIVRPDAIAITTCINSFVNVASMSSGRIGGRVLAHEREEAAETAENLLQLMKDLAKDEANILASGDNSSVVEDEAEVDEYEKFNEEFADFEDDKQMGTSLQPTVITYNSCLNAWAKSDTRQAAPRAHALLQRMLEASLNDPTAVKPNRTSFNTVINAYARFSRYDANAPEKAEELMNLMYDLYYSGRLETVKPDTVTYTSLINAWARSVDRPDKVQNARRLLDVLLAKFDADEEDVKPNIMAYTSVLNAAVHSPPSSLMTDANGEEDPFTSDGSTESVYSIVVQTYDELKKDPYNIGLSPDHFAFAAMLQAVRQHTIDSSAERRQMVELVFDDACAAGEVSAFVIRALREACPSVDLLERLLRSQKLAKELRDVSQLPQDWSRNLSYSPRFRIVDGKGSRHGRQKQKEKKGRYFES